MKPELIFYDVDTQNDFMNQNGALYVPDAELIHPNLLALTKFAVEKRIPILGSVDAHIPNDPEFKVFSPHCIKGSKGQEKIFETELNYDSYLGYDDSLYIPNPKIPRISDLVVKKALQTIEKLKEQGINGIYFEKQSYDVFTNLNFDELLKRIKVDETVVYGVATDYCVKAAVLGMQKRGIQCYVVEDAIKGVKPNTTQQALEEMLAAGAKFVTTKQILEERI